MVSKPFKTRDLFCHLGALKVVFRGGMAEELGSGLQIRVRGCESLYHLQFPDLGDLVLKSKLEK